MKNSNLMPFSLLKIFVCSTAVFLLAGCGETKNDTPSIGEGTGSQVTDKAVFVDDFESGLNLKSIWADTGDVRVSTERAYSGSKSVKFSAVGGGYNRNFMTLDLAGTPLMDEIYGSMMVWIDKPAGNGGDFTFIQAEGKSGYVSAPDDTTAMYRYRVDGQNSNGNLMANYDTWIDEDEDGQTDWLTDCWAHSSTQLPREQWSCVEWYFNKESNTMRFWLNGEEISEINIYHSGDGCVDPNLQGGIWYSPENFERLNLGLEQYHDGVPSRTLYIDDVVVGAEKVGCASD